MKIRTSVNLNSFWNIGSNIGFIMVIQVISGILISMMYMFKTNNYFINSMNIYFNINYGWYLRFIHMNVASLIFMLMLIHILRSLMFKNLFNYKMWNSGILMYLIIMMIAFLGYSLIWSQMSYWAMMVITNFITALPKGQFLMNWMWGNFFIDNILINRFFIIHFLFPMIILMLMILHMNLLHKENSTNSLGLNKKIDLINLFIIHVIKDLLILSGTLLILMNLILIKPEFFSTADSFMLMNYFVTPQHIQPEWYFLVFYAILRSIENKLGSIIMVVIYIFLWFILPLIYKSKFQSNKFNFMNKWSLMIFVILNFIMTMLGTKLSEYPMLTLMKLILNLIMLNFLFMLLINKFK